MPVRDTVNQSPHNRGSTVYDSVCHCPEYDSVSTIKKRVLVKLNKLIYCIHVEIHMNVQ
jgi:hypothetical protein